MKKVHVTASIGTNTLILKTSGWVTKKDLDSIYTDVRFCVADLKPGFHVISDLSDCRFGSLNALTNLRKIMNYLMEMQVGQVIRITRKNSLIHKQIMNFASRSQGYKAVFVHSREEADKLINESDRQKALQFRLFQTPVCFSADTVNGTGYILEISIECCKIAFHSEPLKPDNQVTIKLEFTLRDGTEQQFELISKITEVSDEHFIAEFQNLDEDRKECLRMCIVQEAQKDVPT